MKQEWRAKFDRFNLDPEQCTCLKCSDQEYCPYAFDIYCYEDNCLGANQGMFQGRKLSYVVLIALVISVLSISAFAYPMKHTPPSASSSPQTAPVTGTLEVDFPANGV